MDKAQNRMPKQKKGRNPTDKKALKEGVGLVA